MDDILLGLSVCRNPKLAAVFYRLKLIEAYGTGMPKIMKAYDGSGMKPKIEVTCNAFKVTLPNRNAVVKEDIAHKTDEEQILAFIETNGHIVRSDVDRLLGVSQVTANRILKRMGANEMIYQVNYGKATRYQKK